ncbi:MAG: hypothetical protein KAW94_02340 [Candidatus Thorarchaeota archaeon]|nr:hypothetical protein [Candidatus Thorarchaeota archaeon]
MSESPLTYKSLTVFYVILVVVIFSWVVFAIGSTQYALLTLYFGPLDWILTTTGLLVSMMFPILLITWVMKHQLTFTEPDWIHRDREVDYREFEGIMREYAREYTHIIAYLDYKLVFLAVVLFVAAVSSGALVMVTPFTLVLFIPHVFGVMQVLFGVTFSVLAFRAVPTDASQQFPFITPHKFKSAVHVLWNTPGISWVGVRISIGEAGGYYTIRSPTVVARIDGIESAARIEAEIDSSGRFIKAISVMNFEPAEGRWTVETDTTCVTPETLRGLVKRTLQAYVAAKGTDALLEEILEDLGVSVTSSPDEDNKECVGSDELMTEDGQPNYAGTGDSD